MEQERVPRGPYERAKTKGQSAEHTGLPTALPLEQSTGYNMQQYSGGRGLRLHLSCSPVA
jgi:hypothetical protein